MTCKCKCSRHLKTILDDIGIYDYDYEHAGSTLFNVFNVLLETLFVKPSTLLVRSQFSHVSSHVFTRIVMQDDTL